MKTQLRIIRAELPTARIIPITTGQIGHQFDLLPTVKVEKRMMAALSTPDIETPKLEWKERIEWFSGTPAPTIGLRGQAPPLAIDAERVTWKYVGANEKDMYADNPTSNTFKAWHSMKFFWACNPPNTPPPGLKACITQPNNDAAAMRWIAQNGFEWKIPGLTDRPAMGLTGGSGGGGGDSLVTSNTRRRVIYFDLGFTGFPQRLKCVQILESVNGTPTIQKFIAQDISKQQVDDPANLARWRSQVKTPANVTA